MTHWLGRAWKRFFDLTVALAVLIVFMPVLGLIAVAIKVSSKGPVLFTQERIGWQGRKFRIIKFRSMVRNAPYIRNPDGSAYSSGTDPRVTRLGRILRRSSLDEIPQLWNVVRGEMSLIGPRPELAEGIRSYRPADFRRLNVRPGMTGWAVVHGRNEVPINRRRDLDTWYADHAGFLLDLKILCKTIATVMVREGINRTGGPPLPDWRTRNGDSTMFHGKLGALLPFDEAALPLVRAWINDEEVRRGTGTEGPVSDREHRRWYEFVMDDPAQRIFLIAQGKGNDASAVGVLGLRGIDWRSRHAEYWIYLGDRLARGKGLAEEASRLLLHFAFGTLGLHRVFLQVNVTNQSAISLYRRLGFVEEGTLRAAAFADGRFVDRLLLSMLSHEFKQSPE